MRYIECPKTYRKNDNLSIFLGGGITGCPNWQADVVKMLRDTDLILLNPRRANFDVSDSSMEKKQIHWEHKHMQMAVGIIFWFPKDTLCPITLYELGRWINTNKPLFIGHDPEYKRARDLNIQIPLVRKNQKVHTSLMELVEEVKTWSDNF